MPSAATANAPAPVEMTRAEYQAKYGSAPPVTSPAPVQMTHAEYMAKYGPAPEPSIASKIWGAISPIIGIGGPVANQNGLPGNADFGVGVAKSALKSLSQAGAQNAGPVGQAMLDNAPEFKANTEAANAALQPTNTAQQAGAVAETAGEFLLPFGFGAKAALASPKAVATGSKLLLGNEGLKTVAQIANPEAKAFIPVEHGGAGQTFASVYQGTQKAVETFVTQSKAELQAVKQAIPKDVFIAPKQITSTVNDAILKSVQNSADYHGISGEVSSIFKTPQSLIDSGLLNTEEAAKVKGMVEVIKNWKDTSARGILNLKEQLAPFYKPDLNGSNNILRNIQNGLKDLVGNVHPEIKPALAKASANIDKAEEFARHLLGTNPATGETKLIQLAKNLSNPALKGYQHTLLDQLQASTGFDATPKLKGYADYLDLLAKHFPSKLAATLKAAATGPAAKTAGALTGGLLAEQGVKRLTGVGL